MTTEELKLECGSHASRGGDGGVPTNRDVLNQTSEEEGLLMTTLESSTSCLRKAQKISPLNHQPNQKHTLGDFDDPPEEDDSVNGREKSRKTKCREIDKSGVLEESGVQENIDDMSAGEVTDVSTLSKGHCGCHLCTTPESTNSSAYSNQVGGLWKKIQLKRKKMNSSFQAFFWTRFWQTAFLTLPKP